MSISNNQLIIVITETIIIFKLNEIQQYWQVIK